MSTPVIVPVPAKRRRSERLGESCILCKESCSEDKSNFNLTAWENLRLKAKEWEGKQMNEHLPCQYSRMY